MSQKPKLPFRQEKAQTFVEFALVFPVLLMLVYGIIEFGRMLFIYTAVTASSREGARYGSAAGDTGTGIPHYADCVGIREAAIRTGILAGITDGDISISYDEGPSTTGPASCPPSINEIDLGDRIKVVVEACFEPIIPYLFPFIDENGCGAGVRGFSIDSESRRTILKDLEIEGTQPAPP